MTDNQGQGYVLHKFATPSQPGAAILQVLALHLDRTGTIATAQWRPRRFNTWADGLSKGHYTGFDPGKRWRVPAELYRQITRWNTLMTGPGPARQLLDSVCVRLSRRLVYSPLTLGGLSLDHEFQPCVRHARQVVINAAARAAASWG